MRAGWILGFAPAVAAAALLACSPAPPKEAPATPSPTEDEAPLGHYVGILPCADCEGVRTELSLLVERSSGAPTTYRLEQTHRGSKDGDRSARESGRWTILRGTAIDPDAVVYELGADGKGESRSFLKASASELRLLDRSRAQVESAVLRRDDAPAATAPATELTEADAGRPMQLRAGDEILLRLTTERGKGYAWGFGDPSGGVVEILGAPDYAEAPGGTGVGTESWRLRAAKPGSTTLRFEYRLPYEEDVLVERSLSYPITVR